ncbi:MAG: T9SS type A sorting domain-containing protein [Bacteroidales bacterium]|nr:T9SS type A sorting domain-containing protein [Bacteroidales bacterium]
MKKIYILIPLLLTSFLLVAQYNMPINQPFQDDVNMQSEQEAFLIGKPKLHTQDLINQSVEHTKELIRVVDSSYHYRKAGTFFGLDSRQKTLSRNEYGNPTHTITHLWDAASNSWLNRFNTMISYHETQSRNIFLMQPWSRIGQNWIDTGKFSKYSINGNLLLNKERIWDLTGSFLAYAYNRSFMYDENEIYLGLLSQGVDVVTGEIINFHLIENELNESGQVNKAVRNTWHQDQWILNRQEIYTYDENGYRTGQFTQNYNFQTSLWHDFANYIFTYDENGNQLTEVRQNKNFETNEWYDWWRYDHVYDAANRRVQSVYQQLDTDSGLLTNKWLYSYVFNENGSLTLYLFQGWNPQTEVWDDFTREMFVYDEHNNLTQQLLQNWSNHLNEWENILQTDYFWSGFETTGISKNSQTGLLVFPNPAKDRIYLRGISAEQVEVKVYSIGGLLVKSETMVNNESIDISDLTAGTYILHIQGTDGNFYNRFVKR